MNNEYCPSILAKLNWKRIVKKMDKWRQKKSLNKYKRRIEQQICQQFRHNKCMGNMEQILSQKKLSREKKNKKKNMTWKRQIQQLANRMSMQWSFSHLICLFFFPNLFSPLIHLFEQFDFCHRHGKLLTNLAPIPITTTTTNRTCMFPEWRMRNGDNIRYCTICTMGMIIGCYNIPNQKYDSKCNINEPVNTSIEKFLLLYNSGRIYTLNKIVSLFGFGICTSPPLTH